ncbi:MAG: NosD domain-containing protein [Candidatus Hodarchaeota archaeon]
MIRKNKIIFTTIGIFFVFLLIINSNLIFNTLHKEKNNNQIGVDDSNLNFSALSGRIHIDNNWTAAKSAGICTGSGTYSDPYIIEDLEINAGMVGSCIWIQDTTEYFKIVNCTLYNSGWNYADAGILFGANVDNGQLINNTIYNLYNSNTGIILESCYNCTLSGNIVSNFIYDGMRITYTTNTTISDNNVQGNNFGIKLGDCSYINISGNIANNNDHSGIYLSVCNNNIVSGNNVKFNDAFGIDIDSSTNVTITENYLINNGIANGNEVGSVNQWDNGVIGNYWSDYSGKDVNDDGIGDTPYYIYESSIDNYPIWFDPPVFSVISPVQNDLFSLDSPTFYISILEGFVNSTWYTLNGGMAHLFTGLTGTVDQALWNSTLDGSIPLRIYANDTMGLIASRVITIIKDTTPPIITINSPPTNEIFGNNPPEYNLTIIEAKIDRMWYTLDNGATNFTFTESIGIIDQTLWNYVPEGNVTIRFYVEDSIGYITFKEIKVIKQISGTSRIPGYDLFFLLGILSVVAIIIGKKIRK